jgi:hypothetical protein
MTVLHRTPVHHEVLSQVQARGIEWRANAGAFGRFAYRNGAEITDPQTAIALYELRDALLIHIDGSAVKLSLSGARRLSEWNGRAK